MSRFLSEALEAKEPDFRLQMRQLEHSHGHPNHDIRLTSKVLGDASKRLNELGLDPTDTTAEELYVTLNQKLASADKQLLKHLRSLAAKQVNAEANLDDGLRLFLSQLDLQKTCFSLKSSVLKQYLKVKPPKRVMRSLGFRSVDSMLKHEPIPLILMAINHLESSSYIKDLYEQYRQLRPSDFENRPITFIQTSSAKWRNLIEEIRSQTGLNFVCSYELSSMILFPLTNELESGELTAVISELLTELSYLISISAYLKLHQVTPDFGEKLKSVTSHEPKLKPSVLNQPISWSLAQDVLGSVSPELNLLHVGIEDLVPTKLLDKLTDLVDELKFWQHSEHVGIIKDGQLVSFNLLDVADNLARKSPFENRQTSNFQSTLSSELLKSYVEPDEITANLVPDAVTVDEQLVEVS